MAVGITLKRCLLLTAACGFCVVPVVQAASAEPEPVVLGSALNPETDDTLAFTPDGNTVFFDRNIGATKTIYVTRRVNGQWEVPKVAPFSGRWFDQNPVVSPDGSYLLFDSDRPASVDGKPLVQNYFGRPMPGSNIWRVDRAGGQWSAPVRLDATINARPFTDSPSIAGDGSLYFMWFDEGATHIFRSQYRLGRYLPPQRQPLGDPSVTTHDPAIAPDESFMVFDYGKVKGGLGRLCIAFREGAGWGPPIDLGDTVNADLPWGAHMAPDGQTVYVTGATKIWRLSLAHALQLGRCAAAPQMRRPSRQL